MPRIPTRGGLIYVGVDPGQSGGLATICSGLIVVTPMPATERDIWEWFADLSGMGDCLGVIERVHSMPKQGVASTFKFGWGYGGLRMALIAASIPFEDVIPRTWQKAFGTSPKKRTETKTQWKNRLKAKAQQLFPGVAVTLETADAVLIAEFCRRKNLGLL